MLLLKPSLSEEFKAAEEPEQANVFWHKYISKGKLRSDIFSNSDIFRDMNNDQVVLSKIFDEFSCYQKDEETMMSSALHPSYMGAAMSCAGGISYGKDGFGIFGSVDPTSIRTLSYVFYKCAFLHALSYKQTQNVLMLCIEDQDRLNEVLQRMKFLSRLSDYIWQHRDALPLNNIVPKES